MTITCERCGSEVNPWEEHEDRITHEKYCEECADDYWDEKLKEHKIKKNEK